MSIDIRQSNLSCPGCQAPMPNLGKAHSGVPPLRPGERQFGMCIRCGFLVTLELLGNGRIVQEPCDDEQVAFALNQYPDIARVQQQIRTRGPIRLSQ